MLLQVILFSLKIFYIFLYFYIISLSNDKINVTLFSLIHCAIIFVYYLSLNINYDINKVLDNDPLRGNCLSSSIKIWSIMRIISHIFSSFILGDDSFYFLLISIIWEIYKLQYYLERTINNDKLFLLKPFINSAQNLFGQYIGLMFVMLFERTLLKVFFMTYYFFLFEIMHTATKNNIAFYFIKILIIVLLTFNSKN